MNETKMVIFYLKNFIFVKYRYIFYKMNIDDRKQWAFEFKTQLSDSIQGIILNYLTFHTIFLFFFFFSFYQFMGLISSGP